jgi:hypothetical protein
MTVCCFCLQAREASILFGSMSNYHDDHIDEMEDDYDMDDPADHMIDEHQDRGVRDSDSEDDDYGPSVCSIFFILLRIASAI